MALRILSCHEEDICANKNLKWKKGVTLLLYYSISHASFSFSVLLYPWYTKYMGVYSFCLFSNNVYGCVCWCVCECKLFSFIKDFSGTTEPRILKFGTNVGYNLLYCVRENQHPPAYHSLYLSIFLSLK